MKRWLLLLCLLFPIHADAKPLVADLSQYRIEIDSSFTGTRLLLFGSRNETGDVIIVVRGPERRLVVRRKERVAGIWMNTHEQKFDHAPLYYAIAASRPLPDIRHSEMFAPLHIGLQEAIGSAAGNSEEFANALIHYEQAQRLYSQTTQKVSFMGESLFKLVIPFPDNIPGGDYSADVYLFNDGQLSGMQSIPIHVDKIGFDAFVYDFAQTHSVLYGVLAVLLALGIGWGASSLMQRV